MRPFHVFIFSLLFPLALQAQSDTLYVNDTHILSLVFPEPIARAITGHPNYSFGYATDTPERLGLLQGHPGPDSNLLVLTEDGQAYSFALAYHKKLQEFHRFMDLGESIGNVRAKISLVDSLKQEKKHLSNIAIASDSLQYRKACTHFLKKGRTALKTKRVNGMILRLRDVAYYGKETYLVMEIQNCSDIDFEVGFVQIFKAHGNPRKKSSYQKLVMEPVYKYRMPTRVKVEQIKRFAFVVPKFTLANQEKLLVELREKRGSRRVFLRWH